MSARLRLAVALASAAVTLAAAGSSPAAALTLSASSRDGWVALRASGSAGLPVSITEVGAAATATLPRVVVLPQSGSLTLHRAAAWRCDRRTRRFAATVAGSEPQQPATVSPSPEPATVSVPVTTPSCADRLALSAPGRGRRGRPVALRVVDRWHSGELRVRLCADTAGAAAFCRTVRLAGDRRRATVSLRPSRGGRWQIEARTRWQRATAETVVAPGRIRLLATGDSEIQGIDELLAASLRGRAGVISDAHISTGISKPVLLDWVAHARARAVRDRPDVTVVYIGGNEGFPVPRPSDGRMENCCSRAWIAGYERRVVAMMRSFSRGGRGRVYWFTLPAPSSPALGGIFAAVNRAIVRGARRFPETVRVLDIRPVFTPGWRYRQAMEHDGRLVTVRESDGYHLSWGGNQIATALLIAQMRADGAVG